MKRQRVVQALKALRDLIFLVQEIVLDSNLD